MNKITRKMPAAIFLENYIRSNVDKDFTLTPQKINQSIKKLSYLL